MAIELRLPKIDAPTEKEQIAQIKSYLFQLVQELNWALNVTDKSDGTVSERREN